MLYQTWYRHEKPARVRPRSLKAAIGHGATVSFEHVVLPNLKPSSTGVVGDLRVDPDRNQNTI